MLYLERKPSAALRGIVRSLWYVRAPDLPFARERVLPNGCLQIVISVAADTLTECDDDGTSRSLPAAIVAGARSRYELLDTRDFAELVGVVFRPGGFGPWLRQPAFDFFEQSTPLDAVWSRRDLREHIGEAVTPAEKLDSIDALLHESLQGRHLSPAPAVRAALNYLGHASVRETARSIGLGERRLHQIFRDEVGLSPKQWSCVARFQRAVTALHAGRAPRWDQLALDCGFYDQSHFSNEFRAFSGIDPTTYSERCGPWKNHIAV